MFSFLWFFWFWHFWFFVCCFVHFFFSVAFVFFDFLWFFGFFWFFWCVSRFVFSIFWLAFLFHFVLFCFFKFLTFGQVINNARFGRSRHPPLFRVCKVNLATVEVATSVTRQWCASPHTKSKPASFQFPKYLTTPVLGKWKSNRRIWKPLWCVGHLKTNVVRFHQSIIVPSRTSWTPASISGGCQLCHAFQNEIFHVFSTFMWSRALQMPKFRTVNMYTMRERKVEARERGRRQHKGATNAQTRDTMDDMQM